MYIKFARLIMIISTNIALNFFFCFDDLIHDIYINNGQYIFIDHLPQIIYSVIVSIIIEKILANLSMTDKAVYQIKILKQDKNKKNQIQNIIKSIKLKLYMFFLISLILVIFYFYTVSTFCATYENTQLVILKDAITTISASLNEHSGLGNGASSRRKTCEPQR